MTTMATDIRKQQSESSTTIASWTRFVIAGLHIRGIDTGAILREAGIAASDMDNPNHRISVSHMTQLWQLAVRDTGDPCFALGLADLAQADMFSGLGLAIMFSDTIGEAIQRICRYSAVASSAADLEAISGKNNTMEVIYHLHTPIAGEAIEAFMACGARILKQISHDKFRPVEVHFCHDKSPHQQRFEEFFEAPVIFNAPVYKFVLDEQVVGLPCYQSNPELARSIETWMSEYLANTELSPLAGKVRQLLLARIIDGEVDQGVIAEELAISKRALQRGLKQEGHSFRDLLEDTRRAAAEKFLLQPELSLTDICYILGFSDQSNFTKAFKRWTGQTPTLYRQELLNAPRERVSTISS
jgi:AraC-like DNA-binding protein